MPLEFPVYQICVAKAATLTGLPLEIAGRLISLCFLYLALPAFFLVLRFAAIAPNRRWLFLGLLLVTPVYLFYSRTFLIESTVSPRPAEILAPFGIAVVIIDGRAAFNAHAPTEITFDQPSSAHHVRADFGISPGAYTGDSKTDGVVFDIEVIDRLGRSTVLFERSLRPATVNSDRGTQHVELDLPAPAIGRIIFRTLPGPVNDIAYDWAYWTGVEIK